MCVVAVKVDDERYTQIPRVGADVRAVNAELGKNHIYGILLHEPGYRVMSAGISLLPSRDIAMVKPVREQLFEFFKSRILAVEISDLSPFKRQPGVILRECDFFSAEQFDVCPDE